MELPSYIALSYLAAQGRALEVTAGNLANSGTSGFKAERVLFSDWLGRQSDVDGTQGSKPVAFVQDRATYREQQDGPLTHTGNPLDLAISGEGFFTVNTARGPRLTRAGRFTPQADGTIVNESGEPLLDRAGQNMRIGAADTTLSIGQSGALSSENGPIGTIGIVQPADTARMQTEGSTTLRADTPTAPVNQPHLVQGAIEDSNVHPIIEMARMMSSLRSFQFAAQFVENESTRLQSAIDKLTQRKE